jgi:hypothetical protein
MNAMIRVTLVATFAGCVLPPPASQVGPYPLQQEPPPVAEESVDLGDVVVEGRWLSEDTVASGDVWLELTGYHDRHLEGLWGRYVCDGSSCTKGRSEGLVKGQLDAGGTGWIDLEDLGRSESFAWRVTSRSPETIELDVPPNLHATLIRRM